MLISLTLLLTGPSKPAMFNERHTHRSPEVMAILQGAVNLFIHKLNAVRTLNRVHDFKVCTNAKEIAVYQPHLSISVKNLDINYSINSTIIKKVSLPHMLVKVYQL